MPTGQTLSMGYDSLRRLTSVTGGLCNLSYTYRDRDATYTTTQVSRLSYTRSGATTLNFDYTYDTLGNIKTYKAPSKTAITYTYDNQGQLTKAAGAKTYTYTYDSVGNILSTSDGTTTHNYTYGDTNWGDLLMKFDGQSISYDGAGNPTSYYNGTRWTFGWSNGRSLTSASGGGKTLSFTYDLQDGTRATKTVDGVVHNYIYAGGKLLRETYGNTKLDFIYDVNGRPYAMIVNEATTYYYITNLQGDVINVVSSSGTTVASYEYDPYGYPVVENETALGFTNPLRYRGYYWDAETEMYLCHSRYYDPTVGRFISSDSYAGTDQGILGNNMFAYCINNPIYFEDKQGGSATVAGGICGGIFGFIGAAVSEITDEVDGFRWDKVWQCTLSTSAAGAAAGFVADASIATFGVVPAIFISAGGGAFFSAVNSSYTQEVLKGEIDTAKVASDALIGGITNGLCTGTSNAFKPAVKGLWNGIRCTINQVGTELTGAINTWGNFLFNDMLPTAITGAAALLGGWKYDFITKE